MSNNQIDIPIIINGKEIRTGEISSCVMPHNHKHILGTYHKAGNKEVKMAIDSALESRKKWALMPWQSRISIFKKMASLLQGPYRDIINAATMLDRANAFQAEIDSACELIDFFNFNCEYVQQIYSEQPPYSDGMWNQVEYRGLEGFVFAVILLTLLQLPQIYQQLQLLWEIDMEASILISLLWIFFNAAI